MYSGTGNCVLIYLTSNNYAKRESKQINKRIFHIDMIVHTVCCILNSGETKRVKVVGELHTDGTFTVVLHPTNEHTKGILWLNNQLRLVSNVGFSVLCDS